MREAPVLVLYCDDGPLRVTGRWSDGVAEFDGLELHQSVHRVEVVIDGQTIPVQTNVATIGPLDTFTLLGSIPSVS